MHRVGLTRRLFLGLSVSSMTGVLLNCGSSDSTASAVAPVADAGAGMDAMGIPDAMDAGDAADAMATGDSVPFGVWTKLRDAVRGSPDHLPEAAARVVATKDPKAIFEFVRDQIIAYPPDNSSYVPTQIRWGTRGTLRGGAGTPREKVELLLELYSQAGIQAQAMTTYVIDDAMGTLASKLYLQKVTRTFTPTVDDATFATWVTEMKAGAMVQAVTAFDPQDAERDAIVATVTAALPAGLMVEDDGNPIALGMGANGQLDQIPFVQVMINGVATNANVLFPDSALGGALPPSGGFSPSVAPPPDAAPTVTVTLSMTTTLTPTTPVAIVTASFPADQLAGRQLLAQFPPAVSSLSALEGMNVSDILAFRPLLLLSGLDVDPTTDPSFVTLGGAITLHGDIVTTAADGTVSVNGQPLYTPSQIDPNAVSKVASVTVAVRAGAFPAVSLSVQALDANGKVVLGLPASAFAVTEDNGTVVILETGVPTQSLRVMLILDFDGPLSNGDDPMDLASQLLTAVVAAHPGAAIQLPFSDTLYTDTTTLAAAITALGTDADSDWSELGDAASRNPALIVMVADFVVTDFETTGSAVYLAEIAAGPPIIAVPTESAGDPSISPNVAKVVALSKGQVLSNAGTSATIAAVLASLQGLVTEGAYTLRYAAPATGPATRMVDVTINGASATGMYTVPTGADVLPAPAIASLTMTVSIGESTLTRVLGGYGGGNTQLSPGDAIDPMLLDDVRDALFGVTMLSFEGTAPTFSLQIDELLSTKLALQPAYEAMVANDMTALTAGLTALRAFVPTQLLTMKAPLAPRVGTSSLTYELGLRIVACTHRPRFAAQRNELRIDILPVAGWGSIGVDPHTSFLDTLNRTAGLAVVEAHACTASTMSALSGVALTVIAPGTTSPSALPPYDTTTQEIAARVLNEYASCYRLVPSAAPFTAFWAIDENTGAMLGVLPDGTGGGSSSSACMTIAASDNAINAVGILGGLAGVSWAAPFYAIGQVTAEIYLITAAIFDGATVKDPVGAIGGAAVCNGLGAGLSVGGSLLGGAANAGATYLGVAGLGGAGPLACPSGGAAIGC